MSLFNRTLPNLAQGVSKQFVENRFETQSEEMINCIPDITRGILRRNPLQKLENSILINTKGETINPNEYYSYSYERGSNRNEMYIILLGHKEWYVFDFNGKIVSDYLMYEENSEINLEYLSCIDEYGILRSPNEVFELMTVGDYTFILNKLFTTRMKNKIDGIENSHLRTAVYWIKQTGLVAVQTHPDSGTVVFEGHKFHLRLGESKGGAQANTNVKTTDEVARFIQYEINGKIEDNGNIYNTEGPYYKEGFKWEVYTTNDNWMGGTNEYHLTVYWNGKILKEAKSYNYDEIYELKEFSIGDETYKKGKKTSNYLGYGGASVEGYKVEKELLIETNAVEGNWHVSGSILYNKLANIDDRFEWDDTFGNTASFGFKGEVAKAEDLPENLPESLNGLLVKVGNGEDTSYWLKWNNSAWEESLAPGLKNNIDENTMPHVFIRNDDGTFSFGFYGKYDGTTNENGELNLLNISKWKYREVGDYDTSPNPSFIDKKINNMFSHNNRLGLLSENNVILSETAEYGSFFPTTLINIPDTDVIDLAVATQEVTGLERALSINSSIILFSKSSQFTLFGNGGVLSPNNAEIVQLSNYDYNDKAKALQYKDSIIFTSQSGNGSNILSFKINSISNNTSAVADTLNSHVKNYIDYDITKIVSNSNLNYIFIFSKNKPNEIVVQNLEYYGGNMIQNAFHKWKFSVDILDINILDNFLYIVSRDLDYMYINKIDLSIPKDINIIEYLDKYSNNLEKTYNSEIHFSKFYIKDEKNNGNKRGRLQIKTLLYTITEDSYYKTFITNLNVLKRRNFDNFVLNKDNKYNDEGNWCDYQSETLIEDCEGTLDTVWFDLNNFNFREYINDEKVTVMGNNEQIQIKFTNNEENPTKGFELATVNYEASFNSRSRRI